LKLIVALPIKFRGQNYAYRASERLEEWYIGNASIFTDRERKRLWAGAAEETFSLGDLYKEVKDVSDSTKMQHIDIHTWLVGDILAKADKMTMAHSLELRVPFLDIEVARLAQTLPNRLKWKGGVTKYILREAFKSLLPESTRTRRKLGFPTPVRNWFTANDKELYRTILNNEYIKSRMNTPLIEALIEEHTSGKRDNSRKIYLLLMLALWYNTFISKTA
jgi:asparagine synthase (glutamine-hydrolysing)